ncbi:winged helix-turn-helix domain-containing protein [Serratia sp. JUb9]|uniref:winged helix-turn-helix domain-containing protein n=1 Tax=Serratia sp. JUb9 TaxID=2724469 RepID=UPI00164E3E7C|nr:winged helix-turn-helix domain-containing protein [Serratia sp. JUb9]QNK33226.1 winged helix-turn-helix domain-containing protein [Serratia sp. JUb9]
MSNTNKQIFGYFIHPNVQVDVIHSRIININSVVAEGGKGIITLRTTMMRLLSYLLEHANGEIILNDEILLNVWDKHELSSSTQRLWQVMQALKQRLNVVGIPDDFIIRVETKGFFIREGVVTPLYYKKLLSIS